MSARGALITLVAAAAVAVAAPVSDAAAQSAAPKATNVAVTTPGAVQGLTNDQCKAFKGILTDFIKDVGRQNLSDDFVNAMVEFAINKKCAAPASIPVTPRDLSVFNAISGLMYQTQRVELKKMGIVPVLRTAALQ